MDERRTQLRAQLRLLHPDAGGDVEQFRAVLAEYRALPAPSKVPGPDERDYRGEVRFGVHRQRRRTLLRSLSHPLVALAHRRRASTPRVR